MDATDTLIASFSNLSLPTPSRSPISTPKFHLFPALPTELRHKIYSSTFPPPSTLSLDAKILISDPTFGLYIRFTHPVPKLHAFNQPPTRLFTARTRSLALLAMCQESRTYYLENFPICLPIGPGVYGRLYISPLETLHIKNFAQLMLEPALVSSINHSFRLQDWVPRIERLALEIGSFARRPLPAVYDSEMELCLLGRFLIKCERVRKVEVLMWYGFDEEVKDEVVRETLVGSMREMVRVVEGSLERYRDEVDRGYVVPGFEVMSAVMGMDITAWV